ncbi:hypothetical protein J2Y03_000871 [Neobacillus niacini]|uniref:YolD-like family protein n=1 Tax=Neobacillus niacini TaxID=86668 RepID=UPI00285DE177|nr:YolD-like family protein [Neobacillus niacini]MDR7075883.1 hypothetical protein [Neobacillus niacini]
MAIRDRGKMKWRPASFMPEGFAMTRALFKNQERQAKPLLDEYQTEEFDQRIGYAMENHLPVKLTTREEGFTEDMTGYIHYIDPITQQLRVEEKPGEFQRVAFSDVIAVVVVD